MYATAVKMEMAVASIANNLRFSKEPAVFFSGVSVKQESDKITILRHLSNRIA